MTDLTKTQTIELDGTIATLTLKQQTLNEAKLLPNEWKYTPVEGKAPKLAAWDKKPLSKVGVIELLKTQDRWTGIGVFCGEASGCLVFVDHDGASCDPLIEKLSGLSLDEALPVTVKFTSGKLGRYQAIYRIPEEYWSSIARADIKTDTKGPDGKGEALDLRWGTKDKAFQSVVCGVHPDTGKHYQWINSPETTPVADAPMWVIEQMLIKDKTKATKTTPSPVSTAKQPVNKGGEIPLASCLSVKNRDYLKGVAEGGRDDAMAALARDLIGVQLHLSEIGQSFEGDAYSLLETACLSCDPPLDDSDLIRIFESAQKSTDGPCLDSDKIQSCIDAWYASPNARSDIKALHERGLSGSELDAEKINLMSTHKVNPQAFNNLWCKIANEEDRADGRSESAAKVDELLSLKVQRMDISNVFPARIASGLKRRAELLGSTPEVLMTIGLPTIASQVRIGTTLILSDGSDWEAKPIFWTGFVGAPSSAKTPSFNVWAKPLRKRQGESIDRYKADLKDFEAQHKKSEAALDFNAGPEGEPPSKPIKRIIDDVTTEALARIQNDQPTHGCLIGVDELAGFLDGQNQYKGGKGSDKQRLLSLRDGKGFSIARSGKDGDIMTVSSSFSITGGIQPTVLAKQMGDFSDGDGYWSRFCWCILPLLPVVLESDGDATIAIQLGNDISNALEMIGNLEPRTYRLSEEARELHRHFINLMDDKRLHHPNEAMKVVSGKSKGQVGEIALILHLLWGVGDEANQWIPSEAVSGETMTMAIEVMRFYIHQAELIQSLGAEAQGDENPILVKIIELSRGKGWVTASTVRNAIRSLKDDSKRDAAYVRELFKELKSMDKGELEGEGKTLKFRAF